MNELLPLLPRDIRGETCAYSLENHLLHFLYLLRQARQRVREASILRAWRNKCKKCNNSPLLFYLSSSLRIAIRYFQNILRFLTPAGTVAGDHTVCSRCPVRFLTEVCH